MHIISWFKWKKYTSFMVTDEIYITHHRVVTRRFPPIWNQSSMLQLHKHKFTTNKIRKTNEDYVIQKKNFQHIYECIWRKKTYKEYKTTKLLKRKEKNKRNPTWWPSPAALRALVRCTYDKFFNFKHRTKNFCFVWEYMYNTTEFHRFHRTVWNNTHTEKCKINRATVFLIVILNISLYCWFSISILLHKKKTK